jgi:hypothetical protein
MERPKRRRANMTTDHEFAVVASTTDIQKVFVAIELSKSRGSWRYSHRQSTK